MLPHPESQPPQKSSNKMIQIQLLFPLPHPQPSPEKVLPEFPHKQRSKMIQIIELQQLLSLSPHPQFVATRSLIKKPPNYLQCILCEKINCVTLFRKKAFFTKKQSFVILKCGILLGIIITGGTCNG